MAISTDIWTSIATQAYITVTAHFLLSDPWDIFALNDEFSIKITMLKISQIATIKKILVNFSLHSTIAIAALTDRQKKYEHPS